MVRPSIVQEDAAGADSTSITFAHAPTGGSNRLLVVYASTDAGEDITNVTHNGNGLSEQREVLHSGGKPRIQVWTMTNPDSTGNVVVSISGGGKAAAVAVTWQDVDISGTPFDTPESTQGTSTSPSDTIGSDSNSIVHDGMASIASGSPSQGTNQTDVTGTPEEMGGGGASDHFLGSSHENGDGGTITMSWSLSESKEWVIILLDINEAAAVARTLFERPHVNISGMI